MTSLFEAFILICCAATAVEAVMALRSGKISTRYGEISRSKNKQRFQNMVIGAFLFSALGVTLVILSWNWRR